MLVLLAVGMLLSTNPPVRVVVLPLESRRSEGELASQMTEFIREVMDQMPEVEKFDRQAFEQAMAGEVGAVYRRCAKEKDCRLKIGALLGVQLVVAGRTRTLGKGVLVELVFLDVGSGELVGKVSRTLSGSRVRKAAALEALFTEVLFPRRYVGAIDLFLKQPGGSVYLDGKLVTTEAGAQVHLENVPAGQHTLRVTRADSADFYAMVQVPFQGTTAIEARMRPGTPGEATPATEFVKTKVAESSAWYERWWVWSIIGVVLVGGVVTTVLLVQ